jgi:hypothetical protein
MAAGEIDASSVCDLPAPVPLATGIPPTTAPRLELDLDLADTSHDLWSITMPYWKFNLIRQINSQGAFGQNPTDGSQRPA